MKDSEREPFRSVDRLVERYLDEQAARIDAGRVLSRVRERRSREALVSTIAPATTLTARSRTVIWPAAAVLAVILAFVGGWYFALPTVNAAVILRETHSAHLQNVDRCYRVQFAPDPEYWDGKNPLKGPSDSVLWTRGDRFWADVQIGNTVRLAIGRDETGTLWASPSPAKGIRFADERADLPEEIAFACAVNSMSLPKLVEDVLADFNLQSQGPSSYGGKPTTLVWATLKPGRSHWLLSTALLEIDKATDTIVRLVLWTVDNGEPRGTITFTLTDSATLGDDQYRLESHVDEDAVIERHDLGDSRQGSRRE